MMNFLHALPRKAICTNAEMTLGPASERELIAARIAAANRTRRKRIALKLGLAPIRSFRKKLRRQAGTKWSPPAQWRSIYARSRNQI